MKKLLTIGAVSALLIQGALALPFLREPIGQFGTPGNSYSTTPDEPYNQPYYANNISNQSDTTPEGYMVRYAAVNLNVRSTPRMGENRIDYWKKGDQVIVKKKLKFWCDVKYKNRAHAYSACKYLTK